MPPPPSPPDQFAGSTRDYSSLLIRSAILLVVLVPLSLLAGLPLVIWSGWPWLVWLPFVLFFGVVGVCLLAGGLLLVRPSSVQQLAARLARWSPRCSTPREAGVWCCWAGSFLLVFCGALWFFGDWWSKLPKVIGILVLLVFVFGLAFARDWTLDRVRRHG